MGKYNIIYADPPWGFETYTKGSGNGNVLNHYETMDFETLKNLSVQNICEKDCVLLLWATFPNLEKALELGKAWGFKYKTNAFTWVKKNKKADSYFTGMGYYTRANAEICLLFTKGNPLKRLSKSVRQICDARIQEHSKKPAEIRDRIVELFGDIPRAELFARQKAEGWDCIGDEIDGNDIVNLLNNKQD